MSYILYIDESYDEKSDYVIMTGFGIPINDWKRVNDGIKQIKLTYFNYLDINLKAIRRKNYDSHKLWEMLSDEKKKKFNDDFYALICNPNNFIITALINRNKMINKNKKLFFYLTYGFILQRYQYFLSERSESGLVIMDNAESSEEIKRLYNVHRTFMERGTPIKRKDFTLIIKGVEFIQKDYERMPLSNVCENLIFSNDSDNNMLQIVDMITSAIFAKYNRDRDTWFKRIEDTIRSSSSGQKSGYGIKFFPE